MINNVLAQYLDIGKMENISRRLMLLDLSNMSALDRAYLYGALDYQMAVLGIDNKLSKILGVDESLSEDERKEAILAFFNLSTPQLNDLPEFYDADGILPGPEEPS